MMIARMSSIPAGGNRDDRRKQPENQFAFEKESWRKIDPRKTFRVQCPRAHIRK
jgi:hypothetical protein